MKLQYERETGTVTSRSKVSIEPRWRKTADRGVGISQQRTTSATTLMKVNISFHVVNYRNPVLQSHCVTFTVSLCLSVFIDTLKVKKNRDLNSCYFWSRSNLTRCESIRARKQIAYVWRAAIESLANI